VGLAVLVGWVALAVLGAATNGNTVQNIGAALRTKTAPPRIGSGAQLVATLCPIARRAPGNKLAGKAAICPATVAEPASAIGLAEELVPATAAEPARVTGQAVAEPIASEAATSRAAVAETGTLSEEDREDTMDRALAAAAAAVPQAWDLEGVAEVEAAVAAVAGGADR
jgi:hypothetical protein